MPAILASFGLPLRKWQAEDHDAWAVQLPRDWTTVATPAAGKTRNMLAKAHTALSRGLVKRIAVIVPSDHLKKQVQQSFGEVGILLERNLTNRKRTIGDRFHGFVTTYHAVASDPDVYRWLTSVPTLGLFDEVHHVGATMSWGDAMRRAFDGVRYRNVFSGTLFRSDDQPVPFVNYVDRQVDPNYAYTYRDALRDGVVRPVSFPLYGGGVKWRSSDGTIHEHNLETVLDSRERESERLRMILLQGSWFDTVFVQANNTLQTLRSQGNFDAGGLVCAIDQNHARFLADRIKQATGEAPVVVVSDDAGASDKIERFKNSLAPWLVSVKMVSEGVDIPRLQVGIYATNTTSRLFFHQFTGRFIRTKAGQLGTHSAYVFVPDDPELRFFVEEFVADVKAYVDERRKQTQERTQQPQQDVPRPVAAPLDGWAKQTGVVAHGMNGSTFAPATSVAVSSEDEEAYQAARARVKLLVARVHREFGASHRGINATLKMRCGSGIEEATLAQVLKRQDILEGWLQTRRYDGKR